MAVIFVQKFLKGRAIQEEIRKGKNKTLDLIRELQAVEKVKAEEEKKRKMESEEEKKAKQLKKEQQEKEEKSKQVLETIQGEIVARALDFLSKELVRQQDMYVLEKLRIKAEAERLQVFLFNLFLFFKFYFECIYIILYYLRCHIILFFFSFHFILFYFILFLKYI